MTIFTLIRSEFARLTASRMGVTALIALMAVPVIYGGMYLWGNADPYSRLDQIPAAIVVADTGATSDGERVNYGNEAAEQLLDDQRFGWVLVSADDANTGVTDGTYDFSLTFPANFSNYLVSAGGSDPQAASLVLTTNDTNSYLSTTLAKQAAAAVQVALVERVGAGASRTLLDAVDSLRTGLVDASDGASRMADAMATAAAGATSLSSGSASLAAGAASLSDGLATLDASAGALPSSAAALASGASSVSAGIGSASDAATGLAAAASQAAALSPAVRSQVAAALDDAGVSAADQQPILDQLDALSRATGGTSAIASAIAPNMTALAAGAIQVSTGAQQLSAQAPALAEAIDSAAAGASTLSDGAASASAGATTLSDGIAQVTEGSTTLRDSLAGGAAEVPSTSAESRAATAAAISDPVAVDQTAITEAQNYGAGLAPFFISLAAWIGMYALFLLVRPLSRRALTAVRRPIRTTIAGWLAPAMLGTVQMAALFGVVTVMLGLRPANAAGLLAFMILISVTFAAIVHALNIWLGSVGQFLALMLMIVQLVVAGGTFPWQTLPEPLAMLHQVLPMSHAVEGLRQLMYGDPSNLGGAILPLVVWMIAALAISVLGALKQGRGRTLRELRPTPLAG
ncbi:YhgE/Pip family protein [Salinibacterium sp. G-O1]|uniref:YhgE/Pip family protein n=1 Tax=Salinibacterium sp. G-O1 TaxID=3046208 RepID=UPI0024B9ED11|nr:YhgE/Pip family protein [Salinibacterium sp. G-O1]MDJ0333769.1 YhgE/Pip family protein [Salinibacterium sp. G-O1]